ncbi:hypothetical protein HN018_00900 [Lichenicola cladoniae]|uniref:Glycosyltransferase RgtA/B/C/D-like domain-containing protein n=1 Tax=Lichenicola cladoniae TaxID=1484109 RepID=A0A6M8HEF4_9PROT|nr:hypothetical protein [Lichenicola cladoniae]NPD65202.1 hypothetical protein [Acetobacteraceae bacterium]QKE88800.1 hypothetical protein HN018_00900 [Lichenicola cladoniae]
MRRTLDLWLALDARIVLAISLLLTVPFFFCSIPPLTDLPGHMGSAAVAAYADDPVFASRMSFEWHLIPNMGTDLVVAALRRVLGLVWSYRLVAASIPLLLATGIIMVARTVNPRGAASTAWALVFIYSYPLNSGFLNYMLGVALSLICLASWIRLDGHVRLREAGAWIIIPAVFLCHVVAGCLLVLFIASRELELARSDRRWRSLLVRCRPLLSSFVIIVLWRLTSRSLTGTNRYSIPAKFNALVMLLRDQNLLLDIGTLGLALAVFVVGWKRGARPNRAVVPALLGLILLFIITPGVLGGSNYADERLLPLIPMLAFAAQDWSGVDPRLSRLVALSGLCVLFIRLAVTSVGFASYDTRFASELRALQQLPLHSRVIVLETRDCSALRNWRGNRLDHLGELAIVFRRSWTNSEWDVDGGHLLQIRYRPSQSFYDDPSEYVWPTGCGGTARKHPTIQNALAAIPFDGIDYLWLIDAALPPGYSNSRLTVRWTEGGSSLYAVRPHSVGTR